MKNYSILTIAFLIGMVVSSHAQDVGGITLKSQSRTTSANIGKCDITITYHSPSVNNRKIFGGIVPFDFVVDGIEYPWRAGSNQRTTIEFSHDVEIEGQKLNAGSYGFLALVNEDEWILIFSSGKSWGAFNYDKENDVLRIPVKPKQKPFQDWLSYDFINPQSETVEVQLRWEETSVSFKVATSSINNMLSDLEAKEEKTAIDYQQMHLRTLEKDPTATEKAKEYLEQSFAKLSEIENEASRRAYLFNYKMLKVDMLMQEGRRDEARQLKEEALNSAEGFNIYYYTLWKYTEKGDKHEALKVLKQQVKANPSNFRNHFAFGEYYLKEGNQKKATEHFKRAYELASEQESRAANYARYLYLQNKLILERKD